MRNFPKPVKTKKPRTHIRPLGKVGRGNDAFSQQMLEAWFSSELIKRGAADRDLTGTPTKVVIETADGYEAWIDREVVGETAKSYRFKGINVHVAHIKDKATDPKLRWEPRNVAPLTPYNNQRMKYDHDVRETMQVLMKAWVLLHLGPTV